MDIKDNDTGAILLSVFLGIIAIVLISIIVLVVLILRSSCPFIYTFDGEGYVFQGEAYPGAVGKNMIKDDYLALKDLKRYNGSYTIKLNNELQEIQFTDLAELIYIDHQDDIKVLMDQDGKPYSIKENNSVLAASNDQGDDLLQLLNSNDYLAYSFLDKSNESDHFSALNLTFEKEPNLEKTKLVMGLKNTLWLDHIYSDFLSKWGGAYDSYANMQKMVPKKIKEDWLLSEGIKLSLKMKTGNEWKIIDQIDMAGPAAFRDIVVPIENLPQKGSKLELRLECGFHFWEIDYAYLDSSDDVPLHVETLHAKQAIDEMGTDILDKILSADESFFVQPKKGNSASIQFEYPEKSSDNLTRSIFLHSRGYYEYIRNHEGNPDVLAVSKFFKDQGFVQYAKEELDYFLSKD